MTLLIFRTFNLIYVTFDSLYCSASPNSYSIYILFVIRLLVIKAGSVV